MSNGEDDRITACDGGHAGFENLPRGKRGIGGNRKNYEKKNKQTNRNPVTKLWENYKKIPGFDL